MTRMPDSLAMWMISIQSFRHVVGLITHVHVKQTVVESGRFGQRDQFLRGLVLVWRNK